MTAVYTSAGAAQEVDIIDKTGSAITTYFVRWGVGAGSFARTSTALFTETDEAAATLTASQPNENINQWVGTLTATSAKTISNAGIFDTATSATGTMKVGADFSGLSLAVNDAIQFTFQLRRT